MHLHLQTSMDFGGHLTEQIYYAKWSPSGSFAVFFIREDDYGLGNERFGQQDWRYDITVPSFYHLNVTIDYMKSSDRVQPTGNISLYENCSTVSFVAITSLSNGKSNVYCYVFSYHSESILIDSNQLEIHLHNKLRYV